MTTSSHRSGVAGTTSTVVDRPVALRVGDKVCPGTEQLVAVRRVETIGEQEPDQRLAQRSGEVGAVLDSPGTAPVRLEPAGRHMRSVVQPDDSVVDHSLCVPDALLEARAAGGAACPLDGDRVTGHVARSRRAGEEILGAQPLDPLEEALDDGHGPLMVRGRVERCQRPAGVGL